MAGRRQRHIIIFINSHFSTWQYEKAKCYRVNIKQLKNLDSSDYIAILVLDEIVPTESLKALRSHVQQGLPQSLLVH